MVNTHRPHGTHNSRLTDAVALKEDLLQLTDVRVLEPLQDVDLPREVVGLVVRLNTVQRRVAEALAELVGLDHLHSVPLALLLVERLHNGREGALAELVQQVVVSVQATAWGSTGQVAVDEA